MRVARTVVLSPEERVVLLRWARPDPRRNPRALRAHIVLAAAAGRQDLEIGRSLGVGRLTSARWRARFLSGRLRGIDRGGRRAPRSGGVGSARVRAILRETALGSSVGPRHVSTRSLARRFGVSHTTVRRIWSEFGVRPSRFTSAILRADPVPLPHARDVVGLYLRPPDSAIAFELGPTPPGLPPKRPSAEGFAPAAPHPEAGPLLVAPGAVDWTSVAAPRSSTQRSRDFLRFLAELERSVGRQRPVRVVATTPGVAPSRPLGEWLSRRPNVWVELVANGETWKATALRQLEGLGRLPSRSGRRAERSETARAIGLFLRGYAEASGPFEWTASREEVDSDVAGTRLRYELSVTGHPGFKKAPRPPSSVRAAAPPDAEVRAMARVVLRRCLRVRAGEHVAIESWSETLDYANALVLETYRLGARPLVLYQDEPTYWAAVTENRAKDLARVGDHLRAAIARSDALVTFFGPSDRERFHALPFPTRYRLGEYQDHLYGTAAKAGTRAVQLALGRASPASSRMYGVDLARWKSELVAGTTVDPELLRRRGARIARALLRGKTLELSHPNGTSLKLGLRRRRPEVSDGIVAPNSSDGRWSFVLLPAGVVSVALDERVGEGTFRSNVPDSVGVCDAVSEVEDGTWTFSGGSLERFRYGRGHDVFSQSYGRAPTGKERVGVLSVGLNDRITMAPLLLDQQAGAVTLQIGRNATVGGANSVPWWAWLILRGADLAVDGTPLVRGGRLVE